MASAPRLALLLAVAAVVSGSIFVAAQTRARRSRTARARLLGLSVVVATVGLVAALWLPHRVPDTGSAATLVTIALLWVVGGGLALFGLAAFLGALTTRPARSNPGTR